MDGLVLRRRFKNRESRAFLAAERKTRRHIRPQPAAPSQPPATAISPVDADEQKVSVTLNWPVGQSAQEFVEKLAEQFEAGPLLTLSAEDAVAPATPEIPSWAQIMSTPGSWKSIVTSASNGYGFTTIGSSGTANTTTFISYTET